MGRKHCGKRRNCSLRAISPFPTVFSKGLFPRGVKGVIVWEWVNRDFPSTNLHFPSCYCPERKDREYEAYGGVNVYVKNDLSCVRRHDLEINGLECVWVNIKLCTNKHILCGVFYRPPNSQLAYNSLIVDSVSLVIDTNISDIIITGDANWNELNLSHFNEVNSLYTQFCLSQCIQEPTHFTENSSSILDLVLVTNNYRRFSACIAPQA